VFKNRLARLIFVFYSEDFGRLQSFSPPHVTGVHTVQGFHRQELSRPIRLSVYDRLIRHELVIVRNIAAVGNPGNFESDRNYFNCLKSCMLTPTS